MTQLLECWLRINAGALVQDLGLENGITRDLVQGEAHGLEEGRRAGSVQGLGNQEVAVENDQDQRALVLEDVLDPSVHVQGNAPVPGRRAPTLGTLIVVNALHRLNDAVALEKTDIQDRVEELHAPETGRRLTDERKKKENLKLGGHHVPLAKEDRLLALEALKVVPKEDHDHPT